MSVILRRSRSPLGRSPPLRHATRATSPASTGEHTPGRVVFRGVQFCHNTLKIAIKYTDERNKLSVYYEVDARVLNEADYVIKNNATVRQTAKRFGVGKSTVHYDMTKRLPYLDEERARKVKQVLFINLCERHIRGGLATREKYENMRK